MRILVAIAPVDFRNGVDGLGRLCRDVLRADPMGGAVFVFCNRRRTALKILVYDGQGYWVCQKRLSAGHFRWWPSATSQDAATRLDVHELQLLLWNADPSRAQAAPVWRPLAIAG